MSGGSLDYFYYRVEEISQEIRSKSSDPIHLAFCEHLDMVSEALHDIEWVFSGDYGEGDDVESIKRVLGNNLKPLVYEEVCKKLKSLENDLKTINQ